MSYFISTGFVYLVCQNMSVLVPLLAVDINVLNLSVISWKCASCQLLVKEEFFQFLGEKIFL